MNARIGRFFLFISFLFFAFFLVYFRSELLVYDHRPLCAGASLVMAATILLTAFASRNGVLSVLSVYLIVFSLFHFGLILVIAVMGEIPPAWAPYVRWVFGYEFKQAVLFVTVGLLAYAAGVFFSLALFDRAPVTGAEARQVGRAVTRAGFAMIVGAFLYWFFAVVRKGGAALLLDSYSAFRYATNGMSLNYCYYFLGLGLLCLVVAPPSSLRRLGIGIFALFAMVALPLGLRGEVLFPAFTALAVMSMRKPPFSTKTLVILTLCFLAVITVIKQVRQVGLAKAELANVSANPIYGLIEMGGSIRPVVEVVRWTGRGDEFIEGASYWAPIDRLLVYFIPGWTRPPIQEDDRILGNVVSERAGAIGFSVIAEAFYNFGQGGIVIYMFLTGVAFGLLYAMPVSIFNQLYAGVIMLPLMIQIRNTFVFVPTSMAIGLVCVFFLNKCAGSGRKPFAAHAQAAVRTPL